MRFTCDLHSSPNSLAPSDERARVNGHDATLLREARDRARLMIYRLRVNSSSHGGCCALHLVKRRLERPSRKNTTSGADDKNPLGRIAKRPPRESRDEILRRIFDAPRRPTSPSSPTSYSCRIVSPLRGEIPRRAVTRCYKHNCALARDQPRAPPRLNGCSLAREKKRSAGPLAPGPSFASGMVIIARNDDGMSVLFFFRKNIGV